MEEIIKKQVKRFEDLDVWKEAMQLVVEIYLLFANHKDFGFKDQIQRAAVSIPSNISEGFERQSNKEFLNFLNYAKGSSGEVQTQLYIAIAVKYVSKEKGNELLDKTKKISSMLQNLINYRKNFNK